MNERMEKALERYRKISETVERYIKEKYEKEKDCTVGALELAQYIKDNEYTYAVVDKEEHKVYGARIDHGVEYEDLTDRVVKVKDEWDKVKEIAKIEELVCD
jgi:hypothetical protein|nr:MAG TPA: hypothetical protein [Bacteriophage sp.]